MRPVLRNAVANCLLYCGNALAGLVVAPVLLASLGPAGFGAWKTCQRLFDIAISPDGGSVQALKWTIAQGSARNDPAALRRAIGAAILLWLRWLPMLVVGAILLVFALPSLITGLDGDQAAMVRQVGLILAANLLLMGLPNIPHAVLIGTNQGYAGTVVRLFVLLAGNAAMAAAALLGLGLAALAWVVVAATAINGALCWVIARRRIAWWGIDWPDRGEVLKSTPLARWLLLWAYAQRLFMASETILLALFAGAAVVSSYVLTAYMAQFALIAAQLTTSAFTPAIAKAHGARNADDARRLVMRSRQITMLIAVTAGCVILIANPGFVTLWAGPDSFMGHQANLLIVLLMIQFAVLRNEIQLREASLEMKAPTLLAICTAGAGLLCAIGYWALWRTPESLLLGLLVGRCLCLLAPWIIMDRTRPSWRSLAP